MFYTLQPSVDEGNRFMKSREGRILNSFVLQQMKWLYLNNLKLIQLQVPIAFKRTARVLGRDCNFSRYNSMTLDDILKLRPSAIEDTPFGLPYKDDLSLWYGGLFAGKTRIVDLIMFSSKWVMIVEIKSNLTKGDHYDAAIGQIEFYRDAFMEDFPSIVRNASINALLLTDGCREVELVENRLKKLQICLYDTKAATFLVGMPFSSISVV